MEHVGQTRKLRLFAAGGFILMALTCYFCWEILYQERAILNILRMSKGARYKDDRDHLEEIFDDWFETKKHEVLDQIRKSDPLAGKQSQTLDVARKIFPSLQTKDEFEVMKKD